MSLPVGSGFLSASISNERIHLISSSDSSPEMTLWEKIKEFFCATNQSAALECIRNICHPPAGASMEEVAARFVQLRAYAHPGYRDNIQIVSYGYGARRFCILDNNNREILSATLEAGTYTITVAGRNTSHTLSPAAPQSHEEHETRWSFWEMLAPPGKYEDRALAVKRMHDCLRNNILSNVIILDLEDLNLTSLPEHLPPGITELNANRNKLTALPASLPNSIFSLNAMRNKLTALPTSLPSELLRLNVNSNRLNALPESLPPRLRYLSVNHNQLTALPESLPRGLNGLYVNSNHLATLPVRLPPGLKQLYADNNRLTALPGSLPPGLKQLSVDNNRLIALPESLPPGLNALYINSNRLAALPENLPPGLNLLAYMDTQNAGLETQSPGMKPLNRLTVRPDTLSRIYWRRGYRL